MPAHRKASKLAPIDLEEMEQDPGMRGMLSFLETPPAEKARLIQMREQADRQSPMGGLCNPPTGESPMGDTRNVTDSAAAPYQPKSEPPVGQSPVGQQPMSEQPMGQLLLETTVRRNSPPFIEVEGVGRRRLQYCGENVQDAHTAGELVAYQSLRLHAKKEGRADRTGYMIDLSLRELCNLWKTDHKHAKHLLSILIDKQNIEVIRLPNYRLGLATRYRVFDFAVILQRRRALGLVWVVRTRTIRFVNLSIVSRLISEQPMGQSPLGELELEDESPMGQQPDPPAGNPPMGDLNKTNHPPMGQQPTLLKEALGTNQEGIPTSASPDPAVAAIATILRQELGTVDNDAAVRIVASCRAKAPDAKPREFEVLGRALAQRLKSIRSVDNPVGMMISRLVRSFEGDAFLDFREAARQAKEHEIRRCQFAINDPEEFETIKEEARARLAELKNNDKD